MSRPFHIMALGAHPDDIEISMAGLMIRLARAGHRISWAVATDGAASTPKIADDLVAIRRAEASAAAATAGATLIMLDYPDGGLAWQSDAPARIGALLAEHKPDLIVTHAPDDYHPDHRALSRLVLDTAPFGSAIIHSENMLGVGSVPDIMVDISDVFDTKLGILSHHVSQRPEVFAAMLKVWNRFRGMQGGLEKWQHAEGYCTVNRLSADPMAILDTIGGYRVMP